MTRRSDGGGKPVVIGGRMRYEDYRVAVAADFALQAIELLDEIGEYQATPHLKQAVTILKDETESSTPRDAKVAKRLLRMALVLLDRGGESAAAMDVQNVLDRLGAPHPELCDSEASALIDWWASRVRAKARNRSAS